MICDTGGEPTAASVEVLITQLQLVITVTLPAGEGIGEALDPDSGEDAAEDGGCGGGDDAADDGDVGGVEDGADASDVGGGGGDEELATAVEIFVDDDSGVGVTVTMVVWTVVVVSGAVIVRG